MIWPEYCASQIRRCAKVLWRLWITIQWHFKWFCLIKSCNKYAKCIKQRCTKKKKKGIMLLVRLRITYLWNSYLLMWLYREQGDNLSGFYFLFYIYVWRQLTIFLRTEKRTAHFPLQEQPEDTSLGAQWATQTPAEEESADTLFQSLGGKRSVVSCIAFCINLIMNPPNFSRDGTSFRVASSQLTSLH